MPNAGAMPVRRLRRRASINPTMAQCLVPAGCPIMIINFSGGILSLTDRCDIWFVVIVLIQYYFILCYVGLLTFCFFYLYLITFLLLGLYLMR